MLTLVSTSGQATALDWVSGKQAWAGSGYTELSYWPSATSKVSTRQPPNHQVTYLLHGSDLVAFDGDSATFAQLWSLPLPASDVEVTVVANHLVAFSPTTGQIWIAR